MLTETNRNRICLEKDLFINVLHLFLQCFSKINTTNTIMILNMLTERIIER